MKKKTSEFHILVSFLCLPVLQSLYFFYMGLSKQLPIITAEMAEQGYKLGNFNYDIALETYQKMFFIVGIVALIAGIIAIVRCAKNIFKKNTIKTYPWYYLLLALLFWSIVCTLLSEEPKRQFLGGDYLRDGLSSYFVYAAVFICATRIKEENDKKALYRLFTGIMCYLSAIMFLQCFHIEFLDYCFSASKSTVFNNSNHFGYVLCIAVITAIGLYLYDGKEIRDRIFYSVQIAFLLAALLYNETFGSYLATFVALPIVYLFDWRSGRKIKKEAMIPAAIFLGLSLINLSGIIPGFNGLQKDFIKSAKDISNIANHTEDALRAGSGRLILWQGTIERICERPIFGFGPEGFHGKSALSYGASPHNEYLQIGAFLGIPGLVLYLGALISMCSHHWTKIKELSPLTLAASGGALVYLFSAFFGNPVFCTMPFFWIFLGFTASGRCESEPEFWIAEEAKKTEISNKKAVVICIVAAVAVTGAIYYGFLKNSEKAYERDDLECMKCAELTARIRLQDQSIGTGVYYFDALSFALIPEGGEKPTPCGMGTGLRGGAVSEFLESNDVDYKYDEKTDYRDKVLKIIVKDNEQIELVWE